MLELYFLCMLMKIFFPCPRKLLRNNRRIILTPLTSTHYSDLSFLTDQTKLQYRMDINNDPDVLEASKGKLKEDAPSTANATATASATTPKPQVTPLTRREEEYIRKERSLAEFLLLLDDIEPLVSYTESRLCTSRF
jgi:hypothetical protein